VQRTRLGRARTVAAKGKDAFACQVIGRPRRAADAIVGWKEVNMENRLWNIFTNVNEVVEVCGEQE